LVNNRAIDAYFFFAGLFYGAGPTFKFRRETRIFSVFFSVFWSQKPRLPEAFCASPEGKMPFMAPFNPDLSGALRGIVWSRGSSKKPAYQGRSS